MKEQTGNKKQQHILKEPISTLSFGEEFLHTMDSLGFENLEQLVKRKTAELEKLKGFNTLLIHEYVTFMEKNGLGELVDP